MKFTELSIQALQCGKRFSVWDESLPSFGIRVGRQSKTFVIKNQNRYIVLGRHPLISLKDARDEAKRRMALRYFPKPAIKPKDAIALFLEAQELRPTSFRLYQNALLNYFPDLPLDRLTTQDLVAALRPLPKSNANLTHSVFKAFLNWAVLNTYISRNPLLGIKRHKTKSRDRLITDAELKAIWLASLSMGEFGKLTRSLMLSGQRLSQFANFNHEWIHGDVIVFPATAMKNKQEHAIPLTPALRENIPQVRVASVDKGMKALRAAAPDIPHYTLHDARRYFSSTCARLGVPIEVTEKILAHKNGSINAIAAVYNRHTYLPEMRSALERHENHLFSFLEQT